MKLKLEDIKVMNKYKDSSPSQDKIDKKLKYYECMGQFKEPITLNSQNYIIDGYIWYLVAQQLGLEEVEVTYTVNASVLFGKHPGNDKEFCWKIPSKIHNINVGDLVYCKTNKGVAPVIVTRFSDSVSDVIGELKCVQRKKVVEC